VCLAQYSEDEKWYRALIVAEITSAEKVEVIYVDYGNREWVSLTGLRSIPEHFLQLKAQAFRCSLYNLIQPNGQDPFVWDEAAVLAFREFVDASSCHFELRCTIFALASVNNKELFNIVDLMTPFQSACQLLTAKGVARPLSPEKPLASCVQLHSFYFSTHDIKIGSEEEIFVTHVDDPWMFYCQLERRADVLAQLTDNIGSLSETMTSLETLPKPGDLCLARYTDGSWYRGVITTMKPNKEVFFVDFGNTETIENDNLLPIPSDAYDVLLLPMQAIKCSLSDIANVPKEATGWFKEAVLEKQLKAIVVAKESDGKLLIELFDGNTQLNAKLKEGPREKKKCRSEAQGGEESSKTHVKPGGGNLPQPSVKRGLPGELLEAAEKLSSSEGALLARVGEEKQTVLSVKVGAQSDNKSDFYVQLASDEGQLSTISECLNSEMPAKDPCGQLLQAGDLISAVYSEDSLWYRAVVKGKASGDSVSVQYIDYGNAAVISVDQAHKLPEDLASVPAMAIHCSLSGLQCSKSTGWSEKAIEYFTKRTSEVLLTCEFVEKAGDKWAVMLSDDQGVITVDLADENLARKEGSYSAEILDGRESGDAVNTCQPLPSQALNEISSVSDNESFPWKFPEAGQTVQIYVMVVKGPEYFWSCSADTESINYIEEKIKEAENLGLNSLNSCIKSGDTCLAKYSQDGKLYRARVTSVTDDGVAVRHVDYGSEETVGLEMLRQMPCELLKVPNQAFACCLSG
ncbi:Tudor domain-containing protein 6, partial [Anas platyrhynchos]